MKKIFILFITNLFLVLNFTFAGGPEINCIGLPGCNQTDVLVLVDASDTDTDAFKITTNIITMLIEYTAVIAVISLMISGMMYLVSFGEEEKIKKAKSWIIWSLGGVFISISAWGIINIINEINIFN